MRLVNQPEVLPISSVTKRRNAEGSASEGQSTIRGSGSTLFFGIGSAELGDDGTSGMNDRRSADFECADTNLERCKLPRL
jgi:hypothetical protein